MLLDSKLAANASGPDDAVMANMARSILRPLATWECTIVLRLCPGIARCNSSALDAHLPLIQYARPARRCGGGSPDWRVSSHALDAAALSNLRVESSSAALTADGEFHTPVAGRRGRLGGKRSFALYSTAALTRGPSLKNAAARCACSGALHAVG
jgi:hypothetical protein